MAREHSSERKTAFEGEATRSAKLERYDLIPPEGESAQARRYGLGALKHGEGNWKHGKADFIKATINHLKDHVRSLLENDPDTYGDNDTDAIITNASMLCWFRVRKPEEFREALRQLRDGQQG